MRRKGPCIPAFGPTGGFEGERLSGKVLDGGSDWQAVRSARSTTLDVRLVLETTDGALIGITYRGVRHGPADVIAHLENGEAVDPATCYSRIAPLSETASPDYAWINNVVAVQAATAGSAGPSTASSS
jgi:hypothetical protein